MKASHFAAVLSVVLVAFTGNAYAYKLLRCNSDGVVRDTGTGPVIKWSTNRPTIYVDSRLTGAYLSAVQNAISKVNVNGSNISIAYVTGATNVGQNNGRSELIWSSGADGSTVFRVNCTTGEILEADIFLRNVTEDNCTGTCLGLYYPYTASNTMSKLTGYGGPYRSLESTAIHELGHFLNLGHTSDRYSVMGSSQGFFATNGSTARPYLGADAANGLVATYGASTATAKKDLSVSHFRYYGVDSSGQYAQSAFGRIFNSQTGAELPRDNAGLPAGVDPHFWFRRYFIRPGETVRPEFTFEHNGNEIQWAKITFVLSTDNAISTTDRVLAEYIEAFPARGQPWTTSGYSFMIPRDVVVGQRYWLGVIIDSGNNVAEGQESNNATHYPIEIVSPI